LSAKFKGKNLVLHLSKYDIYGDALNSVGVVHSSQVRTAIMSALFIKWIWNICKQVSSFMVKCLQWLPQKSVMWQSICNTDCGGWNRHQTEWDMHTNRIPKELYSYGT